MYYTALAHYDLKGSAKYINLFRNSQNPHTIEACIL